MAIEVFNRHEGKYLLDQAMCQKIQRQLLQYMEPDEYNRNGEFYTISNIYYDTADNNLIRTSLMHPKYKEKLRLRAYGVPRQDQKVYLEIKKKVCGLVNKRRTTIRLNEAAEFVRTGRKPALKEYMNSQVLNEIEYFLHHYKLEPKLYLAYDRMAMFSKENRDLRITFDTNIRTRRTDLKLDSGDHGEPLLEKGQWLMEIKAEKSMPVWLTHLLAENGIFKTSFSKYGREYENLLLANRLQKEEKESCSNHFSAPRQLIPQYQ